MTENIKGSASWRLVHELEKMPRPHRYSMAEPKECSEAERRERDRQKQGLRNIYNIEQFLETGETGYPAPSNKEVRQRLVSEYDLHNYSCLYAGDSKAIFQKLCEKYERARLYLSYTDLFYAMQDGRKEWEVA